MWDRQKREALGVVGGKELSGVLAPSYVFWFEDSFLPYPCIYLIQRRGYFDFTLPFCGELRYRASKADQPLLGALKLQLLENDILRLRSACLGSSRLV